MPFIAYTLKGSPAKLVPILVGALNVDGFVGCTCSSLCLPVPLDCVLYAV